MAKSSDVFINCPFDDDYRGLFRAIIFAVYDSGLRPRTALEVDDAGEVRIEKILRIIEECSYGIHDISRTQLDGRNRLPRFNMPLELGLFLGAKRYGGGHHKKKVTLVLERLPYSYQKYVSDLAGQDVRAHQNKPKNALLAVRNWIATADRRRSIIGAERMWQRYELFRRQLGKLATAVNLDKDSLLQNEYESLVYAWLAKNEP